MSEARRFIPFKIGTSPEFESLTDTEQFTFRKAANGYRFEYANDPMFGSPTTANGGIHRVNGYLFVVTTAFNSKPSVDTYKQALEEASGLELKRPFMSKDEQYEFVDQYNVSDWSFDGISPKEVAERQLDGYETLGDDDILDAVDELLADETPFHYLRLSLGELNIEFEGDCFTRHIPEIPDRIICDILSRELP